MSNIFSCVFLCVCWPFAYLQWKKLFSSSAHFFNWAVCFSIVELYEFFIYFGSSPLIRYKIYKYFLPFSRLPFYFVNAFLLCRTFSVWCSPTIFAFTFGIELKNHCQDLRQGAYHLCFLLGVLWFQVLCSSL